MSKEPILFHNTEESKLECDFCKETLGHIILHWNETKKEHTCPECKNSSEDDSPFLCTNCFKIDNSNRFRPDVFIYPETKYVKFDQALGISCNDCRIYMGSFLVTDSSFDFDRICKTCKIDFLSTKDTFGFFCSKCRVGKRWSNKMIVLYD